MNSRLSPELLNLSVAERIQLAEDLWDSIAQTPEQLPITEAQKAELERRLVKFSTEARGSSWEDVKKRLKTE